MITYGRQDISDQDIESVCDVLRSDFLTQGPVVPLFESELAEYCGASFGLAVNSATSALHLVCLAMGLGPGDVGWTSPISFVATANAMRLTGAIVDFVDIDPLTFNMSPIALREKLELVESSGGQLPKVVIVVHMAGQSADMQEFKRLSLQYGFRLIEDASHALGACYQGQPVGCCKYSDAAIFSFHPVKMITTGEGGAILTNHRDLFDSISMLRSHGVTKRAELLKCDAEPWWYEQHTLGLNYRMTDVSGALGRSQLLRLNEFVETRNRLASRYTEAFSGSLIKTPSVCDANLSSFHLYVVQIDFDNSVVDRAELFKKLGRSGIGVNVHYIPIYKQPYYQALLGVDYDLPEAEGYYRSCLTIPLHSQLSESDQNLVISELLGIYE